MFEKIGPDIAGHITFTIVALSFMVKDVLWLRSLSITASCFSFIYNYFGPSEPMWVAISWNSFFVSLNLYHISKILAERKEIVLSEKEETIYQCHFKSLSKKDFYQLISHAKWIKKSQGEVLINEGQIVEQMELIYKGKVGIFLNRHRISELNPMQFVGEISFLTKKPASATVVVEDESEMIIWDQADLRNLMQKNPILMGSLQAAIGLQISQQVSRQNQLLAG